MKSKIWAGLMMACALWATTPGCGDDAVCGDGLVSGGEDCDDGNTVGGDGCGSVCSTELGWSCDDTGCQGLCGDGRVVADEVCDPTALGMSEYCSDDCLTMIASCGDGTLQSTAEGCDDGNTITADGCNSDCSPSIGFTCSGEPSACDASSVDPGAQGLFLSRTQETTFCQWFIGTLGGSGSQLNCGSLVFTINSVSMCADAISSTLGSCTVGQFEQWVAERSSLCDVLRSDVPICS